MTRFISLTLTFVCIYLLTYSGRIELGDEIQYFDITGSLARHGQLALDLSVWQPGSQPRDFVAARGHPLRIMEVEPGLIVAGLPLFALAERVAGFGLVHTVFLLNALVTALIVAVYDVLARRLGASRRAALALAAGLGLLTALWPYSPTYFREPLMILLMLLGVVALEQARAAGLHPVRRLVWALAGVAGLALAFLTKEALVLALPGLLILLLPDALWRWRALRWLSVIALTALIAVPWLLTYTDVIGLLAQLLPDAPLLGRFAFELNETQLVLHVFGFSIGGSFWASSPVLLLSVPGAWLLWRSGQPHARRLALGGLAVAVGYCLGYALFRGETWHAGTVWPQRFLLPVLPFALLPALPVFERVFGADNGADRRSRLWRALFVVVVLYALWWQLSGLAFRWGLYAEQATFDQSFGLIHWLPGYDEPRYLRPVALLRLWGQTEANFAWVRAGLGAWPLIFGGLALLMAVMWWRWPGAMRWTNLAVAAGLLAGLGWGLTALYRADPLYMAERADLRALIEAVRAEATPGDVLLVNDPQYTFFLFNYGKVGPVWTPILPYHPGDRGSCEQPLAVESDHPAALLAPVTVPLVNTFAATRERFWLLMSTGPELPCVVRPLERYLGAFYYRLGELKASPTARLIAYAARPAPDPFAWRGPERLTEALFTHSSGEGLRLTGYTLPRGQRYAAGDALALSLGWQVDATPTRDYTVAWFVVDAGGRVVAQGEDGWPGASFAPTSTMQPGRAYWDHRALRLPPTLPAGAYRLWVRLYWLDPASGALDNLRVTGADALNGTLALLPDTLTVTPPD